MLNAECSLLRFQAVGHKIEIVRELPKISSVASQSTLRQRDSSYTGRDGRVAEGARLESVFTRKGNVGSNPTLSASPLNPSN